MSGFVLHFMRIYNFQSFNVSKILFVVGDDGVVVSQRCSGNNGIGCFYFLSLSDVYTLGYHIRANIQYHTIGNKILYILCGCFIGILAQQFYLRNDRDIRHGINGGIHQSHAGSGKRSRKIIGHHIGVN